MEAVMLTLLTPSPYVQRKVSPFTYLAARLMRPPVIESWPVSTSVTDHGSDSLRWICISFVPRLNVTSAREMAYSWKYCLMMWLL